MKHSIDWYKKYCKEEFTNWWEKDRLEVQQGEFKKWWKQLPNILSSVRLCIAPILPFLFVLNPNIGIITAILAASTDCLDGLLARKLNAYSKFGAKLDTLADKLFSLSSIISIATYLFLSLLKTTFFSLKGVLFLGLTGNMIGELIIGKINVDAFLEKKTTQSSVLGKLKTWPLFGTIILSLIVEFKEIIAPIFNTLHVSNINAFLNSPVLIPSALVLSFSTLTLQMVCVKDYQQKYQEKEKTKEVIETIPPSFEEKKEEKEYTYSIENQFTKEKGKQLTKTLKKF